MQQRGGCLTCQADKHPPLKVRAILPRVREHRQRGLRDERLAEGDGPGAGVDVALVAEEGRHTADGVGHLNRGQVPLAAAAGERLWDGHRCRSDEAQGQRDSDGLCCGAR